MNRRDGNVKYCVCYYEAPHGSDLRSEVGLRFYLECSHDIQQHVYMDKKEKRRCEFMTGPACYSFGPGRVKICQLDDFSSIFEIDNSILQQINFSNNQISDMFREKREEDYVTCCKFGKNIYLNPYPQILILN